MADTLTLSAAGGNYVHADNAAARELFDQRTVWHDAPRIAPHLRPGIASG